MQPEAAKWLEDMRQACEHIAAFTAGKTLSDYDGDLLLRSAVERQFEIIGVAMNRLLRIAPDLADRIAQCRRIIAFRNILAHGYDVVDAAVAWDIAQRDLPVLLVDVTQLLGEAGPGCPPSL
jgi:uncharacterized protein with HEPN domain